MDNNKIHISGIVKESSVDFINLNYVIFVQGCNHKCEGCHNKHTWDYSSDIGAYITFDEIINDINNNPLLDGLVLSGGEPLDKVDILIELCKRVRKETSLKNITCFSGYVFEEIIKDNNKKKIIEVIDYLIDGPFILEKKDYRCLFRGSTNQRIIDIKETIKNNYNIVLFDEEKYMKKWNNI